MSSYFTAITNYVSIFRPKMVLKQVIDIKKGGEQRLPVEIILLVSNINAATS